MASVNNLVMEDVPTVGSTNDLSSNDTVATEGSAINGGTVNGSNDTAMDIDNDKPSVIPAVATKGGRETSDRVLYVGNLDKSITEEQLRQYFQVGGTIANVKVMVDKRSPDANYGFVEYVKSHDANVALQTLTGVQLENRNIKLNWAFQLQPAVATEESHNLFVGDLNVNVDDETLSNTFKGFASFLHAHVMWDMQTSRSRGYGFVSFGTQEDAAQALATMNGQELNGRPMRVNWATKRDQTLKTPRRRQPLSQQPMHHGTVVPGPVNPHAIEEMIRSAPPRVTTVYLGNIPHFATEPDLIPLLQNFGFILDFSHYPEKGCCFVKYDTHEQAAVCIVALANFPFQGRNLRTGWGKERSTFIPPQGPGVPTAMAGVNGSTMMPNGVSVPTMGMGEFP